MLLTVDVGNNNITVGAFKDSELVGNFRMTTSIRRTSDEYGIVLRDIMDQNKLGSGNVAAAIVSSVVPAVNHSLISGIIKYFDIKPIIVAPGVDTGITVDTPFPEQIGSDRIVDAAGAYYQYGGPILVLDFGTATTYDYIDDKGRFLYGVTAPGIRISAKALWEDAAKLPEVEIKCPDSILARETISSMQAGLVYGQIGATEYIVEHMKKEIGRSDIRVVATGGLGGMISRETPCIETYDPNLTLHGLRFIYERQQS